MKIRKIPGLVSMSITRQTIGSGECNIHLIGYSTEQFCVAGYAQSGIHMPDALVHSVRKRKAEFFFGRLAAAMALHELGLDDHHVSVGDLRQPVFPSRVVGSITHTDTLAAATVLSADRWHGVGIDVENPISLDALRAVERTVLCATEVDVLKRCSMLTYPALVALIFSAKESFYKAMSTSAGRVFDYRAVRLEEINSSERLIRFCTTEPLHPNWPSGKWCDVDFTLLPDGLILTAFAW